MSIMVLAQLMAYVEDMGTDVVSSFSWAAAMILACAGYAGTFACAVKMLVFISVLCLPPATAYSVAGIGNRAQSPAFSSARHLGARAKLDPAPVESTTARNLQRVRGVRSKDMPQTSCSR